jgi:hypothetical protein
MILLIILVSLASPIFFWSLTYSALHGRVYEMDYGSGREGSFLVCYALYRRIYWVIFGIGIAGAAYFASWSAYPDIGVIFLAAAIYAFLFNGWMAYCYESFLHAKYPACPPYQASPGSPPPVRNRVLPSNYSGLKYSITLALAFSSLLLFLASLCLGIVALIER